MIFCKIGRIIIINLPYNIYRHLLLINLIITIMTCQCKVSTDFTKCIAHKYKIQTLWLYKAVIDKIYLNFKDIIINMFYIR